MSEIGRLEWMVRALHGACDTVAISHDFARGVRRNEAQKSQHLTIGGRTQ